MRYLFALLLLVATADAGILVIAEPLPEERIEVSAHLDNAARDILGWPFLAPENFAATWTDTTTGLRYCTATDEHLTAGAVYRFSVHEPLLGITYKDAIPPTWLRVVPDAVLTAPSTE